MTPGPNIVLKIVYTGTLVKITSIASGNTFGARYWTDGKREAPMLPDSPWLRRHPATNELFWTTDCEQVAEEEPWGRADTTYRDVPFALDPTGYDYELVLLSGSACTPEKKRYARMRRWWASNDPVRHGNAEAPPSDGFQENLEKLRELLDVNDPVQRLTAVEVSRQLRDFDTAATLLDFPFPEDYEHAVQFLKKLVGERDFTVRELT